MFPQLIQGGSAGTVGESFTIVGADSLEPRIVRVEFSDQPRVTLPTDPLSADNPDNWSFDFELSEPTFPVCPINCIEVRPVDGSFLFLDLILDQDMSLDAQYSLEASENIRSIIGFGLLDNSADFLGFRHPLHIDHQLELYLHMGESKNRDQSQDQRRFLSAIQEVFNTLWAYADRMQTWHNPQQLPYGFVNGKIDTHLMVDRLLADLGNPFKVEMGLSTKKKLATLLVSLYQQKGTDTGIIGAIRVIMGIEVTIRSYNLRVGRLGSVGLGNSLLSGDIQSATNPWYLGWHVQKPAALGVHGKLGNQATPFKLGSSSRRNFYTFDIVSPIRLTASDRRNMLLIARYMKPAHTHIGRIIVPDLPVNHWRLGRSHLGSSTKPCKLH